MAEGSAPEERTEDPTAKRMEQLRKDGAIHVSTELAQVLSLIAGFIALKSICKSLFKDLQFVLTTSFKKIADTTQITYNQVYEGALGVLYLIGPKIFLLLIIVSTVFALTILTQTNWNIKEKKIDFKFSNLNPINGIKRVFSVNGVVNTLKAILKLALIIPIAYYGLKSFAPQMIMLMHHQINDIFVFIGKAVSSLFWKIISILIALAIFDYFWGKHRWLKSNRMTKDEVKDERKAIEGDEKTKMQIRQKGFQRIRQQIAKSVPLADVVITNPTHFAVALKYDPDVASAPVVVAKGADYIAEKIKEIAREHNVPVIERKPLARALYAAVEVGEQIPYELYKAVSYVFKYVYSLKNPKYRRTV
ncbi:MAG: flagellar biosynthesis protein FlhB [Bdellovibrionota bacterium]